MSTKHLVFAGILLAAGVVGYLLGASGREGDPVRLPTPSAPERAGEGSGGRGSGPVAARETDRTELAALVAELRDEVAALRESLPAAAPAGAAGAAGQSDDWEERLRSREPTVVMDTVCRLRERLLARAMDQEARADAAERTDVSGLSGPVGEAARINRESEIENCRKAAARARAASEALGAVRTLEDLARWRAAHRVYD